MPVDSNPTVTITCDTDSLTGALATMEDALAITADSNSSFAEVVTYLAREYRKARSDGQIPVADYVRIVKRLHAAANRAGISYADAAQDLRDEIEAGPISA